MSRKTVKDCHRHALKRAKERYEMWFTEADLDKMARDIRCGNKCGARHLLNESGSRSHWLLYDQYIIVYNKNLKCVTTFLPPESIYQYLKKA